MLSQKDRLGGATPRMDVLVGGRGVTVSEQIVDAEKVARALGELGRDAVPKVVGLELR
jgi:hypothetical protein